MAEEQVKVEHHPGQSIKMDRSAAEAFVRANPGARILGDAPEAKAVRAAEVEDKAVRPKATKRQGRKAGQDEDGD